MTTDLQVLDQACRNTRGWAWIVGTEIFTGARLPLLVSNSSELAIRTEYNRLLRLKKKRKRAA